MRNPEGIIISVVTGSLIGLLADQLAKLAFGEDSSFPEIIGIALGLGLFFGLLKHFKVI